MTKYKWFLLVIGLFCAPLFAQQDRVTGTFTVDGNTAKLTHVYVWMEPNTWDETKMDHVVIFCDAPLSAELMHDRIELSNQAKAGSLHVVQISINPDQKVEKTTLLHQKLDQGGVQLSGSPDGDAFQSTTFSDNKIAGKAHKSDESFGHKWEYSADFSAGVTAAKKTAPVGGAALPPDGGAPGKVYQEYLKAIQAGDLAGLKKNMVAERAKELEKPEAKEMLGMIKAFSPPGIKVNGGTSDGKTAVLNLTASDKSTGTVTLVMENGAWKISEEKWKSKMN
jgi:hypothetical protein